MRRFLGLFFFSLMFFHFSSAYAEKKTFVIPRESLERTRDADTICGSVSHVEEGAVFIQSNGLGRVKIDFDGIDFPGPLDEIIKKNSRVIATGRYQGEVLFARRLVVVDGANRKTFVSHKPVEMKLKGKQDVRAKAVN